MSNWSSDWLPAARDSLVALRGSNGNDAGGNPVPMLSVVDATSTLAVLVKGILGQLNRMASDDYGPAARTYALSGDTLHTSSYGRDYTITAEAYLAGAPPPPGVQSGKPWHRSPMDYGFWGQLGEVLGETGAAQGQTEAWAQAFAGLDPNDTPAPITGYQNEVKAGMAVYAVYTPNGYDDTSGQLAELRGGLVTSYQRALDAIGSGANTQADMAQAMNQDACVAFWQALCQVGASLDTLDDVPPRPPTTEVLQEALDTAARELGNALATAANVAGKVVGEAAKGITQGLGLYGAAFVVGVLAIWFAVH